MNGTTLTVDIVVESAEGSDVESAVVAWLEAARTLPGAPAVVAVKRHVSEVDRLARDGKERCDECDVIVPLADSLIGPGHTDWCSRNPENTAGI